MMDHSLRVLVGRSCLSVLLITWAVAATSSTQAGEPDLVERELRRAQGIRAYHAGDVDESLKLLADDELVVDPGASYFRGLARLQLNQVREARAEMERVTTEEPRSRAESQLMLGVTQLLDGDAVSALSTLTDYERRQPQDRFASFFTAVAYQREGQVDAAATRFQAASSDPVIGPLAQASLRSTTTIAPPTRNLPPRYYAPIASAPQRDWHISLLLGYQHDTNVTASPEIFGLGGGQDIEDSSATVTLFGDVRLWEDATSNVGMIGSIYSSFYFDEGVDFSPQDYMTGLYANRLVAGNLLAGLRYEFHESTLDFSRFASTHRLTPNFSWLMGELGHLTAYYELEHIEFHLTPLIDALDRDVLNNAMGLTQAFYTGELDGRIYVGYRYENGDADGTDFDVQSHMVTARVEHPLSNVLIVDAEYRHFWDDFDHMNSLDFMGRPRSDRRSEVRVGGQYVLAPNRSLRLDYTYFDSNSNVANLFGVHFYGYDRHLVSCQYIIDY